HVVTSSQRRGAEAFAVDLAEALVAHGLRSEVVALTAGPGEALDVPVLGRRALAPATLRALRHRARGAAVVVAHGSRTLPATVLALAGRRRPVVYRSIGDPRAWAGGAARRGRTRALLHRTAAVTALWPEAADAIHALYGVPLSRLHVIPNGVPASRDPAPGPGGTGHGGTGHGGGGGAADRARLLARAHLGLAPEATVVAVVGALTPEKRVADAVAAVAGVEGATLLVVGDGPQRPALERRARALGDRVLFTGVVPGTAGVLAASDVVLSASATEGMPGALIEAGLAGLPVVATAVGGVPTVVRDGETGLLVPPGDVAGLADALTRALDRRVELGAAARAHCLASFEIGAVAERWAAVLRSVGAPAHPAGPTRPSGVPGAASADDPGAPAAVPAPAPAGPHDPGEGGDDRNPGRPVRVLVLTKGLGRGGAERLIVGAARLADRRQVHLEVAYLLPWKDAFVDELRSLGTPVHLLDGPRASSVAWLRRLRRLVRQRRIDVVHTHMPLPAAYARLALPGPRPAFVHTEHNMWERYRLPTRWANAATFRRNSRAIAVSDGVAASIRSAVPVEVVVHGTDPHRVVRGHAARLAARATLGVPTDGPVVGTVGNLTAKKDQATLMRAVASLATEGLPVSLVLVGAGPLERHLGDLAGDLGIADRTYLAGSRDDVFPLLPGFDVFALSSRFEGLPIALLEAMASGVAAVATRVGGVPEVITDGVDGLLVEPGDVPGMARALRAVLGDEGRRSELARRGRRRALAFDLNHAVRRTEAIYRSVAGPPRSTATLRVHILDRTAEPGRVRT
ncbi:MAG TPA: glycosyltransferase, partial [Acidimicrobiales bacterium]|nr:glycosyltransferase [Acidimicrobiales bacterium]